MQPKTGITISQALDIINKPNASVSIQAVTLSISRNTGGKRIFLEHCKRVGSSHSTKANGTITVKETHKPDDFPITLHTALIEKINGRDLL